MSIGKYSPLCPHDFDYDFEFNAYGEIPAEVVDKSNFDPKTMGVGHDEEGFDSYGYSSFDIDGNYVGTGKGIDRYGYTEEDYLIDSMNGGTLHEDLAGWGGEVLTSFPRKR